MSTSIHNGYLLSVSGEQQLEAFVAKAFDKLGAVSRALLATHLAWRATEIHDRAILGLPDNVDTLKGVDGAVRAAAPPLDEAVWEARAAKRRIDVTGGRDPGRDFDFQLFVCFLPDGRCLVRAVFEQAEFVDVWRGLEEVVEYFYWDNEDPDRLVSAEEWALRKLAWYSWEPSMVKSFRLLPDELPNVPLQDIFLARPLLARRARKFARHSVLSEHMLINSPRGADGQFISVGAAFMGATDFLMTNNGQFALEEKTREVAGLLASEITAAALTRISSPHA